MTKCPTCGCFDNTKCPAWHTQVQTPEPAAPEICTCGSPRAHHAELDKVYGLRHSFVPAQPPRLESPKAGAEPFMTKYTDEADTQWTRKETCEFAEAYAAHIMESLRKAKNAHISELRQQIAELREEREQMVDALKKACDREWKDETPRQVAIIAANAIYWRDRQITDLQRERDEAKKETEHYIEWANCAEGHAKQVTAAESTIAELREALDGVLSILDYKYFDSPIGPGELDSLREARTALANSKEKP